MAVAEAAKGAGDHVHGAAGGDLGTWPNISTGPSVGACCSQWLHIFRNSASVDACPRRGATACIPACGHTMTMLINADRDMGSRSHLVGDAMDAHTGNEQTEKKKQAHARNEPLNFTSRMLSRSAVFVFSVQQVLSGVEYGVVLPT